jgi:hypothetical protein
MDMPGAGPKPPEADPLVEPESSDFEVLSERSMPDMDYKHEPSEKELETIRDTFEIREIDEIKELADASDPLQSGRHKPSRFKAWFNCDKDLEGWTKESYIEAQKTTTDKNFEKSKKHPRASIVSGLWVISDKRTNHPRVIVPEAMKAFALGTHHNIPTAGHQGVRATIGQLSLGYYWKGMHGSVKRWIRACSGCGCRKPSRPVHAGITVPVMVLGRNMVWSIDIVGPLLVTSTGNRYIITMCDCFTRWSEALAIPNYKEKEVLDFIYALVCRRGRPDKIVTDQGKSLVAKAVKTMCKRWSISDIEVSAYNQQANGCGERSHRYLMAGISILFDRKTPDWDNYIAGVLFSSRVSICDSTGSSPYFMEHGENAKLPASLNLVLDNYKDYGTYEAVIALRLNKAWDAARKLQFEVSRRNHRRLKQHRVSFKAGDDVDIWMRARSEQYKMIGGKKVTMSKGFRNAWVGPYPITSKLDDNHYVVKYKGKDIKHNVNRLRLRIHWDDINRDTSAWYGKRDASDLMDTTPDVKRTKIHAKPPPASTGIQGWISLEPLHVGEEIIWKIAKDKISKHGDGLPFGVGLVTDSSDPAHVICHIFGNPDNNANASYQQMWYQMSDNRTYFRQKPLHPSHIRRTTANNFLSNATLSASDKTTLLKQVHLSDVDSKQVIYRSSRVCNARNYLSTDARNALMKDPYTLKAWGLKEMESEKAIRKSLKRKN